MSKIEGVLRFVDLAGGFFELVEESGKAVVLDFGTKVLTETARNLVASGARVAITGTIVDTQGISMTSTPVFVVKSLTSR